MSQICLGPFITKAPGQQELDGFQALNIALEFATPTRAILSPLYRRDREDKRYNFGVGDFSIAGNCVPCDVQYRPSFSSVKDGSPMIRLDDVLLSFYRKYPQARSLRTILEEIRTHLSLREEEKGRHWDKSALRPEIAAQGYRVSKMPAYGRALDLEFAWFPPQDADAADSPISVSLACAEFRASADRTLGMGKWRQPRRDLLGMILREEVIRKHGPLPGDLLSPEGMASLIEAFPWSSLTLMTSKQARAARLEFLKNHPELWSDHKALATALVNAGLYLKTTDVYHIRRSIPKLLSALN